MKIKHRKMNYFETVRTLLAIGTAVAFTVIVILFVSDQPASALYSFFVTPILYFRYWSNIIELMTPLLFTGLAVTFILQTKVYNLAVEGMFYVGGMAAAMVAILMNPGAGIHVLLAMSCGALAGAVISLIPSVLKLKFEANEIVSSLMLNYIVFFVGDYLLKTLIRDPGSTFVSSKRFKESARLFEFSRGIHFGLVIAAVLMILAYVFLYHTKWGYAIRMCGENREFARYSGIGVTSTILLSQIIGGLIAGLGGAAYMMGSQRTINYGWRSGYGWDGIMIAIIARNNPKYVPLGAFLLAYLRTGADIMSRNTSVQNEMVSLIQGVIIILIAATGFLAKYKKKLTIQMMKEQEVGKGEQG